MKLFETKNILQKLSILTLVIFCSLSFGQADSVGTPSSDSTSAPPDSLHSTPQPDSVSTDSIASDSAATQKTKTQALQSGFELDIDTSRVNLFLMTGLQFVNFQKRSYFEADQQAKQDTLLAQAMSDEEAARVNTQRQPYAKVNLAFPLTLGLSWHFTQGHYISAAAQFLYNRENSILSEGDGTKHELFYVLQAFPAYLEYRTLIPKKIASIKQKGEFSIFARCYWLLPGTEIYTNYGLLEAETPYTPSGWGVFLGYKSSSFKRISFQGKLGYANLKATSSDPFSKALPSIEYAENVGNAEWNLGGLTLEFSLHFHMGLYPSSTVSQEMKEEALKTPTKGKKTETHRGGKPKGFNSPSSSQDRAPAQNNSDDGSEGTSKKSKMKKNVDVQSK